MFWETSVHAGGGGQTLVGNTRVCNAPWANVTVQVVYAEDSRCLSESDFKALCYELKAYG